MSNVMYSSFSLFLDVNFQNYGCVLFTEEWNKYFRELNRNMYSLVWFA